MRVRFWLFALLMAIGLCVADPVAAFAQDSIQSISCARAPHSLPERRSEQVASTVPNIGQPVAARQSYVTYVTRYSLSSSNRTPSATYTLHSFSGTGDPPRLECLRRRPGNFLRTACRLRTAAAPSSPHAPPFS